MPFPDHPADDGSGLLYPHRAVSPETHRNHLSFGNNYGSHSGTSLLETYLNRPRAWPDRSLYRFRKRRKFRPPCRGILSDSETKPVEFSVGPYESSMSLQIWKSYTDDIDIVVVHPDGTRIGPLQSVLGTVRFRVRGTELLFYYGMPSPHSQAQEIYLDLIPVSGQARGGQRNLDRRTACQKNCDRAVRPVAAGICGGGDTVFPARSGNDADHSFHGTVWDYRRRLRAPAQTYADFSAGAIRGCCRRSNRICALPASISPRRQPEADTDHLPAPRLRSLL